jgi:hypothetical protein
MNATHTATEATMNARIHNAGKCTFDGSDLWLGVIYLNESRRFTGRDLSPECDTREECAAWCRAELARRGEPEATITIEE